jgi:hemoglobin
MSLYERVGGDDFFVRLVDAFYDGVASDEVLLRLYPEQSDLTGARERLRLFLIQYWGGPTTYSDERGHPRLRQRHFPFAIGALERDRWLVHMLAAVEEVSTDEGIRTELTEYMVRAAELMVNVEG